MDIHTIPWDTAAQQRNRLCCKICTKSRKIRKRSRKFRTSNRDRGLFGLRKDQRRVIFRFRDGHASDVDLIDDH